MLYQRLRRFGISQQILLHVAAYLLEIRRHEERAVHVVQVLADGLHADAPLSCLQEHFQYLLVVSHWIKKAGTPQQLTSLLCFFCY